MKFQTGQTEDGKLPFFSIEINAENPFKDFCSIKKFGERFTWIRFDFIKIKIFRAWK